MCMLLAASWWLALAPRAARFDEWRMRNALSKWRAFEYIDTNGLGVYNCAVPNFSFPPFLLPLIFINITGHMALSGGRLSGSLLILKEGNPEALVGVFMALFSVVPVMTSLATGRWIDRIGAARVLRLGMAFLLVGAWLPVVSLTLPSLLLTAVLIGFGFSVVSMAAQTTVGYLVQDATPAQRLANYGWFAMGHSASGVFGPFISGLLIDGFGFRYAFLAMALFSSVAAFLVLTRVRRLPGLLAPVRADDTSLPKQKNHVLDLLKTKEMRRIYWVNALSTTAWDLFIVMLPVLGYRLGYSAAVIGTVFSAFAVGTFSARAAMPWLAKRYREWEILRTSMVVIAAVFVVFPWATLASVLMLLGLIFGAAVGMTQPNMLSLLHRSAPPGRGGEAVGLRAVCGSACSVAVPLLFGAVVGGVGLPVLLLGGAVLFGTGVYPAHQGVRAASKTA
jgi:MFS family permease